MKIKTWGALKEFVNTLDEKQLRHKLEIDQVDQGKIRDINVHIQSEPYYVNSCDNDDQGTASDLGTTFEKSEYVVMYKKGQPVITVY